MAEGNLGEQCKLPQWALSRALAEINFGVLIPQKAYSTIIFGDNIYGQAIQANLGLLDISSKLGLTHMHTPRSMDIGYSKQYNSYIVLNKNKTESSMFLYSHLSLLLHP